MRVAAVVGVAALLVTAAHGASVQAAEVTMPAKLFAPRDLDVLLGTTVTWHNADTTTHTVTQDDDEFDSGFVRPGNTFTVKFSNLGTFVYHCTIHRFMRGSVSVFDVVLRGPHEPLAAGRKALLEGVAPADVAEVVLERVVPGPVETLARAKPDPEGAFRFFVPAPEPRRYRVRAGSAQSPLVRIRVAPRVSIEWRRAGVAVRALPARPGAPVALQRYDRELFAFVTVARSRLDSSSRTIIRYRPQGPEHLRAVVRGTRGWSDGFSRSLVATP